MAISFLRVAEVSHTTKSSFFLPTFLKLLKENDKTNVKKNPDITVPSVHFRSLLISRCVQNTVAVCDLWMQIPGSWCSAPCTQYPALKPSRWWLLQGQLRLVPGPTGLILHFYCGLGSTLSAGMRLVPWITGCFTVVSGIQRRGPVPWIPWWFTSVSGIHWRGLEHWLSWCFTLVSREG